MKGTDVPAVFFMISTIYMVQTNSLPVSLPQSSTAKQETRPNVVPITVLESDDVLFDKDTMSNQKLAEKVHSYVLPHLIPEPLLEDVADFQPSRFWSAIKLSPLISRNLLRLNMKK